MSDLSAYEIARLANIRRNQAELERLGLVAKARRDAQRKRDAEVKRAAKAAASKRRREAKMKVKAERPEFVPRRSKRLRRKEEDSARRSSEDEEDGNPEAEVEDTVRLDYDTWPHESSELDGKEFLVYVKLRAWRLAKKNELDCEPYKICQNRTLCELIRRKRNDPEWARLDSPKLEIELVECWGIGPAKAADTPKGFGRMLVGLMTEDKEIAALLEKSRQEPEADIDTKGESLNEQGAISEDA